MNMDDKLYITDGNPLDPVTIVNQHGESVAHGVSEYDARQLIYAWNQRPAEANDTMSGLVI